MTRGQIRTLLRKRIQEITADQWTDSDLNLLIELALQELQREIMSQRGDAFVRISTAPWAASKTRFLLPSGCLRVLNVEVKSDASSEYMRIKPRRSSKMIDANEGSVPVSTDPRYAVLGKWLEIKPAPTTTTAAGIRLRWVPSLAVDDDSIVPEPDLVLHEAIIYGAKIRAFRETEEDAKDDKEELAAIYATIPRYYRRMDENIDQFEIGGIDTDRSD